MQEIDRRTRPLVAALVAAALAGGCSTHDAGRAVRLDAFRPDGTGGPGDSVAAERVLEEGVVYAFERGDVLTVHVRVGGPLVRTGDPAPLEITLEQPLFVYAGPDGLRVSEDGISFEPIGEAVGGALAIDLGLSREDRRNDVTLRLEAVPR